MRGEGEEATVCRWYRPRGRWLPSCVRLRGTVCRRPCVPISANIQIKKVVGDSPDPEVDIWVGEPREHARQARRHHFHAHPLSEDLEGQLEGWAARLFPV